MSWWLPHNFEKRRGFLQERAKIIKTIRSFFDMRGFMEVETPILQVCPVMDAHIHAFSTDLKNVDLSLRKKMYLQTSPEFDMKKLMVAGIEKPYQICHVFRNGEASSLHSPEFTILEWYRVNADYRKIMEDCVDILRFVSEQATGRNIYQYNGRECDVSGQWEIISVCDAFKRYADIELAKYLSDKDGFARAIRQIGVRVSESDMWDDLFFAVMAEKIEPNLGIGVPAIIYDYPLCMASLSRAKSDDPEFAERFELYICGVELANAFSELTDAREQRQRFDDEMNRKQKIYGESYPADDEFFKALEYGLPESAGIALGIDRLIMLATGARDIHQVIWSPVNSTA